MSEPYYRDEWVTIYHGGYVVKCYAWGECQEQSGSDATGLVFVARMCRSFPTVPQRDTTSLPTTWPSVRDGVRTTTHGSGMPSALVVAARGLSACIRSSVHAKTAAQRARSAITSAVTRQTTDQRTSPSFAASAIWQRMDA